jgi:signal transduction histidine kinase
MLDLVRKNAPRHMDNPEFRKDMLESIDDALKRMAKVQTRLAALKGEIMPSIRAVKSEELFRSSCERLSKKLPDLKIELECLEDFSMETDPEFISQILENLLINAREAGAATVRILVTLKETLSIAITDDGPGILPDLLPNGLFEAFKTTKAQGSGIGLWQVRQLTESLGGEIQARNIPEGGARFTVLFPIHPEPGQDKNIGAEAASN